MQRNTKDSKSENSSLLSKLEKYIEEPTEKNLRNVRTKLISLQNANKLTKIDCYKLFELFLFAAYQRNKKNAEQITLSLLSLASDVLNKKSITHIFGTKLINPIIKVTQSAKILTVFCDLILQKSSCKLKDLNDIFTNNLYLISINSQDFPEKSACVKLIFEKIQHAFKMRVITVTGFLRMINQGLEFKLISIDDALRFLSNGFNQSIASKSDLLQAMKEEFLDREKSTKRGSEMLNRDKSISLNIAEKLIDQLVPAKPPEPKESQINMEPFLSHLSQHSAFSMFHRLNLKLDANAPKDEKKSTFNPSSF